MNENEIKVTQKPLPTFKIHQKRLRIKFTNVNFRRVKDAKRALGNHFRIVHKTQMSSHINNSNILS